MPNYDAIVADADQQIARASRTKRNSRMLIARSKNTVEMSKEIVRTSSEIWADRQRQHQQEKPTRERERLIHGNSTTLLGHPWTGNR